MRISKTVKYFITFNKPTILQSIKSYKNSPAQKHLHDFVRSQKQLQNKKKQIDYDFINKESSGSIMIRQYRFQQKTKEILIPHLECELFPNDTWTQAQILKELGTGKPLTDTQVINNEILSECQEDLKNAFVQYYNNLGKANYNFNFQEQIKKVQFMSEEQFNDFSQVLRRSRGQNRNV